MINYITNLGVNEHSGGWSGMNHNVYNLLKEKNEINLIQEINPGYSLKNRIISKSLRILGFKGVFPAFTEERLKRIENIVTPKLNPAAKFNFFHGSTPWINVVSEIPYALYTDACFATYIEIYHRSQKFRTTQLSHLYKKEARFLDNAYAVFFSSQWALNETKAKYKVSGQNFHVAGLGGGFSSLTGGRAVREDYFLFVGLDFLGKGGLDVIKAFNEVWKEYNHFRLKIVGGKPPDDILANSKVEYLGFINKTTAKGSQQMYDLFAGAYCLVLPTTKDLTPLVLVEAGSVGCPVISTRSFGIPEIVKDNETGILLDMDKGLTNQIEAAVKQLCRDKEMRDRMSKNSKSHIMNNFTWEKTGDVIEAVLKDVDKTNK